MPYTVESDTEGVRLAFLELLEEGFQRGKMERAAGDGMSARSREQQLEALEKKRTLAAGYYRFCTHIFRLDAERVAGIPLDPHSLAHYEGTALRTLAACRNEHKGKHPACSRCGTEQDNRHHPKCTNCKASFAGKGSN